MKKIILGIAFCLIGSLNFAQITGTMSSTSVMCNGGNQGTAIVTPSGGYTPYTYLWSNTETINSIAGLYAGTYSVTVTDDSLDTYIGSVNITEPTFLTASVVSQSNITCNGSADGSITTSVTGGTPGYIYSWSHGPTAQNVSNLPAGTYTLTVTDANGCSSNISVVVSEPTAIVATIATSNNVTCNGMADGAISLSATGGTPSYTYSWSNGANTQNISNLVAGTYTATIMDMNNCTLSINGTVNQPTAISIALTPIDETTSGSCDGSIAASVSGGTPGYVYSWSNGATSSSISNVCSNSYGFNVTDANGCTQSDSVAVNAGAPTLVVSGTSTNETTANACDGTATLTVSGGTAPYTYAWQDSTLSGSSVASLCAGSYVVNVYDATQQTTSYTFAIATDSVSIPTLVVTGTSTNETTANACDGTATLTVSGGTAPYTYAWQDSTLFGSSVASLCAGTYVVNVYDATQQTTSYTFAIATDSATAPTPMSVVVSKENASCEGVCDGVATLTINGGQTPYAFAWSSGQNASSIANLCAGSYSYTVTGSAGSTKLGYINISNSSPMTVSVDSTGVSNATCGSADGSVGVTVIGGAVPYSYAWSGGQSSASLAAVASGMHTVVVTDSTGCKATFSVVIADVSGPSVAVASSTNANCGGADGTVLITVSGGVAPYTYLWANGVTQQNLLDADAGVHYVEVTDANGCVGSTYATIASSGTNAPTINGTVMSQAGGNIVAGYVAIYADAPYTTAMDTIATSQIDNEGNFFFSSIVPIGDYILQVHPDVTAHPNAIPTYNGLTNRWDSATVVSVACDENWTYTITTFDLTPLAGASNFSGVIISDGTGGRRAGDPIPGIDVSLEQVPGGIIAFKETDETGEFKFSNVPTGNGEVYQIHVDIPGLENGTTYTINTASTDTTQAGLDFVVSESGINTVAAVTPGIALDPLNSTIRMYPNPSNGEIFFNVKLSKSEKLSYTVYNIVGESIQTKNLGSFSEGSTSFNITGLAAGVYTIAVNQGVNTSTFKALVVE